MSTHKDAQAEWLTSQYKSVPSNRLAVDNVDVSSTAEEVKSVTRETTATLHWAKPTMPSAIRTSQHSSWISCLQPWSAVSECSAQNQYIKLTMISHYWAACWYNAYRSLDIIYILSLCCKYSCCIIYQLILNSFLVAYNIMLEERCSSALFGYLTK